MIRGAHDRKDIRRTCVRRLIAALVLLLPVVCVAEDDTAPDRSVSIAGDEDALTVIVEDARLRDVLEFLAHYESLTVESCVPLERQVTVEIIALPLANVLEILLRDFDFELETGSAVQTPRRLRILPKFVCRASCDMESDVFGPREARNASR